MLEKYKHETRFENYLMDMLWAPAHGMQFKDYKRYHELSAPTGRPARTGGKEILSEIMNAW